MARKIVEIENCTLIKSTTRAGLYQIEDSDESVSEVWIPWSQLQDDSVDKDGDSGSIFIPLWLAENNDLEYIETEE